MARKSPFPASPHPRRGPWCAAIMSPIRTEPAKRGKATEPVVIAADVAAPALPPAAPTYVVGHKNPDADAICSAIAYAAFKDAREERGFVPARCGNSNA